MSHPQQGEPATAAVSDEQTRRELQLTDRVVSSFERTEDLRLKTIMEAAVRHLHAFVREVRLTEAEWQTGIDFFTAVGQICDDRRQEFILLSDTLGASMQTIAINNEARGAATEATVFGPFYVDDSPEIPYGGDMSFGAPGEPCWVEGTVTDLSGAPIEGARIEVWEADGDGLYDVQYTDGRTSARAHMFTDAEGRYGFWGLTPVPYPIPYDGPVGQMLKATGRSPLRAPHLHFMVTADGSRRLVTHIFVSGSDVLAHDSVFGVKDSLIKDFERQPAGAEAPPGREVNNGEWSRVRFDIVLAPAE